jgi:hypothetical protein
LIRLEDGDQLSGLERIDGLAAEADAVSADAVSADAVSAEEPPDSPQGDA